VARARPFGETVVTGTLKFCNTTWSRTGGICAAWCVAPSLSRRYGQRRVHCGEQIFDDFVKGRPAYLYSSLRDRRALTAIAEASLAAFAADIGYDPVTAVCQAVSALLRPMPSEMHSVSCSPPLKISRCGLPSSDRTPLSNAELRCWIVRSRGASVPSEARMQN
jgi:hypothetical protein